MNKEFIEKKLELLDSYLSEIDPHIAADILVLVSDKDTIRILERLFQLIVDTAIDINRSFIESSDAVIPDTYQSTFYTMSEISLLENDFSGSIAPSVGLRNRIVHRYDDINMKVMVESIKKFVPLYGEYSQIIKLKVLK